MSLDVKQLSEIVLGLDWRKHLPISMGDYTLNISTADEFYQLKKSPSTFLVTSENSDDNFIKDINSDLKDRYLRHACDFFIFKKNTEVVGTVICEIQDWTTYYLRYITINPEHRNNNLTLSFVKAIEHILQNYKIEKITCDVSPTNLGQVSRMSQAGYVYTGNVLSERFGANIRLTKFIKDDCWKAYNQNFIQRFYKEKHITPQMA